MVVGLLVGIDVVVVGSERDASTPGGRGISGSPLLEVPFSVELGDWKSRRLATRVCTIVEVCVGFGE